MDFEVVFDKEREGFDADAVHAKLVEIFGEENVSRDEVDQFVYSKDYTLITTRWTLDGKLAAKPDFVVWPGSTEEISELLRFVSEEVRVPVIPFGEGSGVVGGALPIFGGIVVDMKRMDQLLEINGTNLTARVQAGKNGWNLERELNQAGYTLGHVPQSVYTSSLGGYVAHRAAGQFSTKYGKIEDMVMALEAVLPTGDVVRSKPSPRSSTGPQVDKLLVGSEGTLGVVTEVTLRIWPAPEKRAMASYAFDRVEDALESIRQVLRRQANPAVVRIYDHDETSRHFYDEPKAKKRCMVVFVCEGYGPVVDVEVDTVRKFCERNGGVDCGEGPVEHWFETRFNVSESSKFPPIGVVADTIEVSVMWDRAAELYHSVIKAMKSVPGCLLATGHASHFYPQGVCWYFTFGGTPVGDDTDWKFYRAVWDAATKATLDCGGSISHHHGVGVNRSHWMRREWGTMFPLLQRIKRCLDPKNVMNPGKLYEGEVDVGADGVARGPDAGRDEGGGAA
ncbi:MAG: FAD-binding oxidoreductase [Promethearchaeota archaeon]